MTIDLRQPLDSIPLLPAELYAGIASVSNATLGRNPTDADGLQDTTIGAAPRSIEQAESAYEL